MTYRYTYGPSLSDQGISPDDIDDSPPECHCGEPLPVQPTVTRRLVGYPDETPFTEVRLSRTCPACGAEHEEQGWYE